MPDLESLHKSRFLYIGLFAFYSKGIHMKRKQHFAFGVELECDDCKKLFIYETNEQGFCFSRYGTSFFWITECCGETAHYKRLFLLEPRVFEIIN